MLAKQAAVQKEIYCTTDTPLAEVFQILVEKKCACVAIVESLAHRNIIGAVTEHDICLKTITDGLNPQRINAGRVMNGKIQTISGEATLEECAELLKLTAAERLFVIDDDGGFCGFLTGSELETVKPATNPETVITNLPLAQVLLPKIQLAF